MSRGDLQEMEQSKTAVNANAKAADPMLSMWITSLLDKALPTKILEVQPLKTTSPMMTHWLSEPKVKTVSDVVNKGPKPPNP